MAWHFKPIVLTARSFEPGRSYAKKDPFATVATVQLLGEHRAYVCAMLADGSKVTLSRRDLATMAADLRRLYGVTSIEAERNEKEKSYDTGPAPLETK